MPAVEKLIDTGKDNALPEFVKALRKAIKAVDKEYDDVAIVCIGTDRDVLDSLAPIVGYNLTKRVAVNRKARVYGMLGKTLDAMNLKQFTDTLETKRTLVIAIDASVGKDEDVGCVKVKSEGIRPGSGANKNLQAIGDIGIAGILMEKTDFATRYIFAHNVRLYDVMQMAEFIEVGVNQLLMKMEVSNDNNWKSEGIG